MSAQSNLGCGEEIYLKKKTTRTFDMQLQGKATIQRYSKSGEFLGEEGPFYNTITAAGFDEFIRLVAGISSLHFSQADSSMTLTGTSSPVGTIRSFTGATVWAASATPLRSPPAAARRWEWRDNTADTYDPNFLHFWYGDPESATGDYVFGTVDISAAGSKPADENWHYSYILELYSTDTDFTTAGFSLLLDLMTGLSSLHLNSAGIRLRPTTGAGSGTDVGADLSPNGNPAVNTSANSLTWVWTVADGTSNGTWAGTKIKVGSAFGTNLRWGGCRTNGTSCGTKGAGEEWEYTYVFTVSAGSAP